MPVPSPSANAGTQRRAAQGTTRPSSKGFSIFFYHFTPGRKPNHQLNRTNRRRGTGGWPRAHAPGGRSRRRGCACRRRGGGR
uniref:Uncharacterized protein n=1 Tax=Arundo donax TaxID=35708 RepID=A0A0A9EV70_ARUDO